MRKIIDADKLLDELGFKAPSAEDIAYQIELANAEKLKGQFNLTPSASPLELEREADALLEEALKRIR